MAEMSERAERHDFGANINILTALTGSGANLDTIGMQNVDSAKPAVNLAKPSMNLTNSGPGGMA